MKHESKRKLKAVTVFGTRPEAIKIAPVLKEAERLGDLIDMRLAVTAQHRELLDSVLNIFDLTPDLDLDIMKRGQSLEHITTATLEGLTRYFETVSPDVVLVHGDTTTTFTAALAAFYLRIPVAHVEAGLRTGNRYVPYPEEMNRRLTDELANIFLAPTQLAKRRLIEREISADDVFVTGNTVVDALLDIAARQYDFEERSIKRFLADDDRSAFRILITMHRRESWGEPMRAIFTALAQYLDENPELKIIYPVHPNPIVVNAANEILGKCQNVTLIDSLNYISFVHLMKRCDLIVSDSGGIQEEAPSFGKYTLVMREATERPEVVDAGFAEIGCQKPDTLIQAMKRSIPMIQNGELPNKDKKNPVGDGKAAERTISFILYKMGFVDSHCVEFSENE